jgi:hypothetical protein
MIREKQMDSGLPCQNCATHNQHTDWWCKGTGAHPPQPGSAPTGASPTPPDESEVSQHYNLDGRQPKYVYSHTALPNSHILNHDPYSNDSKNDNDFIPNLLTDEEPSTS